MTMEGFAEYGEFPYGRDVRYVGQRMWYMGADGRLSGKYLDPWIPGESGEITAHCPDGHLPPCTSGQCGCGLWAHYGRPVPGGVCPEVAGIIEGLGTVVAGPKGWRAERARLLALSVPVFSHGWPPAEGTTWVLSINDFPERQPLLLESRMTLKEMGGALGERYGVPVFPSPEEAEEAFLRELRVMISHREVREGRSPLVPV